MNNKNMMHIVNNNEGEYPIPKKAARLSNKVGNIANIMMPGNKF